MATLHHLSIEMPFDWWISIKLIEQFLHRCYQVKLIIAEFIRPWSTPLWSLSSHSSAWSCFILKEPTGSRGGSGCGLYLFFKFRGNCGEVAVKSLSVNVGKQSGQKKRAERRRVMWFIWTEPEISQDGSESAGTGGQEDKRTRGQSRSPLQTCRFHLSCSCLSERCW